MAQHVGAYIGMLTAVGLFGLLILRPDAAVGVLQTVVGLVTGGLRVASK